MDAIVFVLLGYVLYSFVDGAIMAVTDYPIEQVDKHGVCVQVITAAEDTQPCSWLAEHNIKVNSIKKETIEK